MGDFDDGTTQKAGPTEPASTPATTDTSDSFWGRIKRHKVVEWSLAYVAFGYAALHGSEMLREALEWPASVPRLTFYVLLLGLPIAATLAWFHGHRAQHRVNRVELAILVALLLVAGSVLWWVARTSHERPVPLAEPALRSSVPGVASSVFNPPAHSIAVLPFTNLSGDPKQEYFSDGMSEELINALSQLEALQVTARTSSFSFKGQNIDVRTIASRLNVRVVLEGSIRRSGNMVRVTTQLIDAVNGYHLWSQDYDRNLHNVLALQSEIATTVARELQVKLLENEAARIEVGGTRTPEAYDAYLRGRQKLTLAESAPSLREALSEFDRATELDPLYADVYAARAVALIDLIVANDQQNNPTLLREQARQSAERAVSLSPDLAYAHAALWFVRALGYVDFASAAPEIDRAVALAPGNAWVLEMYAVFQGWLGHHDRALDTMHQVLRLDPRNYRFRLNFAGMLYRARRYDEALAALTYARELATDARGVSGWLYATYLGMGKVDAALRMCESTATPLDDDTRHLCLAECYHARGKLDQAFKELKAAQALAGDSDAFEYATLYAQWGDADRALDWLSRAVESKSPSLQNIRTSWELDPIRADPRFKAIERRLNFPP